ncbi:MAG: undecaprenyldiphospho-muramoylpentapeptide beta-N-acetylglucosaminyltransferase [Legionellaceae bacterium]|nr:undecaprenyldiphospho-muramoylpentapeptide beta-N-acetylglucosaminyltransferase [Legionellaceae bacterium]
MTKHIVLTGGGTAGHVTPNMALIPILQHNGWTIHYIGSRDGVEKKMIEGIGIPFHSVCSGKLRRYFSWKNFTDPWRLLKGIIQSYSLLRKLKTDVVFSKGGFVALPVVIGAHLNRIPVIVHESDMTPGLANRLSFPFAKVICLTFTTKKKYIKGSAKVEMTGSPLREQLFRGDKEKGLAYCGFVADKPCLLVMGGGQGSTAINQCIRASLDVLLLRYQVIHLCGPGKLDERLVNRAGYCQLEYANKELADLLAACDIVLSRAGANSLCEILALKKPHILVPLSRKVSRGDQIQNAAYFEEQGISTVIQEESLSPAKLMLAIDAVELKRDTAIEKMANLHSASATTHIFDIITSISDSR